MANLKTARSDRFFQSIFALLVNQCVEFASCNAIEERAHFVVLSRNLKFDAAIRKVTNPASYVEPFGCMAH